MAPQHKLMKPAHHDPELRQLLRAWPGNASLPPRFRAGVWQRITTAERVAAPALSLPAWLANWFAQPACAPVCTAVLLFAGLGTGYYWAGHAAARWEAQLSSQYAASINPYAATPP